MGHSKRRKRARYDVAKVARSVVEQAIGEKLAGEPLHPPPKPEDDIRNQAAVAFSKLGASKGGMARQRS